jgi:antigen flippase
MTVLNRDNKVAARPHSGGESYRKIFKSSALLGGARVINMVVGMARVKAMALLLGTVGVGVFSIYEQIVYTLSAISSLGIGSSGVREVALAAGSGDRVRLAQTAKIVRRVVVVLGLTGTVAMIALAWPISRFTFKDGSHRMAIICLAASVAMTVIGAGLAGIVQGLGRMGDLARQSVMGGVIGAVAGLALIAIFREHGIVPALLSVSGGTLFAAWWYDRKVGLPPCAVTWGDTMRHVRPLVTLGLAMMNASVVASLVGLAAQALVSRQLGAAAVGIYACAFNLSGKFVSLVIIPMWSDFFPRASAVSHDHAALNQAVNEQTEIALFLAAPGLLATIVFGPWIIRLFYSHAFDDAAILLRWFSLGCLAGVMGGPMKMVQVAMGRSLLCLITETFCSALYVAVIYFALKLWGLPGSAIAYVVFNGLQLLVSLLVAHRLAGLAWSGHTTRNVLIFGVVAAALVGSTFVLSEWQATIGGALVTMAVSCYCLRQMIHRLGAGHRLTIFALRVPVVGRWLAAP